MGVRAWQELVGVFGVFTLITVVLTVIIWQSFISVRAKASAAREQAYQELAARAVAAQEDTARELTEARAQLAELQTRLASVERILREVE
ncbi:MULTISPECIES: hypothetical protein [unclassified Crossiella]|uniref:hypothetical protein n=1 Tax=unclassified Crossiella TaxID=2620835 RepID=UPI001FFE652D|nr:MULTISPECIES: hypothetical protein [unclassified Crossiella]MCK2239803.1 hypothetical protein [Crossiella sp. S99.2]MCK2252498.1 hypothetical protein [Crossiella sp. S99.1]